MKKRWLLTLLISMNSAPAWAQTTEVPMVAPCALPAEAQPPLAPLRIYPPGDHHWGDNRIAPTTFAAVSAFNGWSWTGHASANGGREVALLIPQNTNLAAPIELVVYFHGHGGNIAHTLTTQGLRPLMEKMAKDNRSVIFMLPNGSQPHEYHADAHNQYWMHPAKGESLVYLKQQVLFQSKRLLDIPLNITSVTVKGFSGGGQPIANAALSGTLEANRIDLMDATYNTWGLNIAKYFAIMPPLKMYVSYTAHNRQRALQLKQHYPNVELLQPLTENHDAVPQLFFDYPAKP